MLESDTTEPQMLDELDVQTWYSVYWAELERRISSLFARSDARQRALAYLAGLLSPAERKNSWQLAEITGDANPYGFQHLLGRADWDADALRDRLGRPVTCSDVIYNASEIFHKQDRERLASRPRIILLRQVSPNVVRYSLPAPRFVPT